MLCHMPTVPVWGRKVLQGKEYDKRKVVLENNCFILQTMETPTVVHEEGIKQF